MRPLVLVALLCGCAEGRSTLGAYDADDVPSAVLSEELRLGTVDEPDQGFSQVHSVAVDRQGHAYVLDALERYVRVYDENGRRVRSIGGPGEGPGEFGSDRLVMGLTGDTLWVADAALRRTTLFALDGSVLSTVHSAGVFETVAGISMIQRPGGLRGDGRLDALLSHSIPRDPPVDTLWVPRLVFDRGGNVVDTLGLDPLTFREQPAPLAIGGQRVVPIGPPDDRALRLRTADDGVLIIDRRATETEENASISLTWLSASQDTLAHRALRYRPRPFDAAMIDTMVWARARLYESRGLDPAVVAAALARALELPAFQPPISQARLGQDGSVLLRRERDASERSRWLLIAPDATPRATFELDPRAQVMWASGDVLWVLEPDDFDVPWLVRYRIAS